jgi:hypothetical protein
MKNQDPVDQELITLRVPTHSDFIIHWTGHDIASNHGIKRINEKSYKPEVVNDYLDRLLNILKYGLWLTKKKEDDFIYLKSGKIKKPNVARVCFTELKLSDSHLHARNFGALGIGVKRYFLFNRFGAPMHYVHDTPSLFLPPNSKVFDPQSPDYELLSFFKNMSSGRNVQRFIDYDLYEESEWRIVFSENIRKRIPASTAQRYFIDPRDPTTGTYHEFYNSLPADSRPDYLTPLDEWTALIIYPNLQIKNAAYKNQEIRNELHKLKCQDKIHNRVPTVAEGCPDNEITNQVMEIDIGAIRNF